MQRLTPLLSLLCCSLALAGCGDDETTRTCGEGTVEQNGSCVSSSDEITCGPGTAENDGTCVRVDPDDTTAPTSTISPAGPRSRTLPSQVTVIADEPATIYYTVDGSAPTTSSASADNAAVITGVQDGVPVQFFAVDVAGNEEAPQTETFTADAVGPGAVTELVGSVQNDLATLSWTLPSDADVAGVIVVHAPDDRYVTSKPEPGVLYSTADVLPGGDVVVFAGTGDMLADTSFTGVRVYAVWAHDDLGNYSPLATTTVAGELGALTASLSVDLATEVVTVSTPPVGLSLSGTATYDDAADTLVIDLEVENTSDRILHSLKAVTTATNQGTATGDDFRGNPAITYGPAGLDTLQSRTRELSLDGIDGSEGTITIDLSFVADRALIVKDDIADASGFGDSFDTDARSVRQAAVGPLGRRAYLTSKAQAGIQVLDLSNLVVTEAVALGRSVVSSSVGIVSRGNDLFVANTEGAHWNGTRETSDGDAALRSSVEFVRVDARTLEETGRLVIAPESADAPLARQMTVSPDGTTAVVLVSVPNRGGANEAWFVDLATFTLIDTDTATAGTQPVTLSSNVGMIEQVAWDAPNGRVFVGYKNKCSSSCGISTNGGDASTTPPLDVIDVQNDYALSSASAPITGLQVNDMFIDAGRLFFATDDGLAIQLLSDDSVTTPTLPFTEVGGVIAVGQDRYWILEASGGSCTRVLFDASTGSILDADDDPSNGTDTALLNICGKRHGMNTVTPF